jgi:fructokinase
MKMKDNKPVLYGGIEAGGTKFVCAVGSAPGKIGAVTRFATTTPRESIQKAMDFFRRETRKRTIRAIGVGSFGPLDLDPESPTFGHIMSTPKDGWAFTDIAGGIKRGLGLPVYIDTDVNAAALGEQKWGAARGLDTFIYVTVGTGVGGGGLVNGKLMRGLVHPEMGHLIIPHDQSRDPFAGSCPFHGDCLEGLASGTAMEKRWGVPPDKIPPEHPAWELEAAYLAAGVADLIYTLSPRRIIIGGGIMKAQGLIEKVRNNVLRLLNDYVKSPEIIENIDKYIVPPGLGDLSGVLGAIALAQAGITSRSGR